MSDIVKKKMNARCCPGGLACNCCNDWFGKDKKKLARIVRRTMKQKDKQHKTND